ncbi:unnamed protein product [Moneuplotes crassus]|uniref:non-specific serine/threonine protein kinase n=1 Tax=Euplotes crassus TaxID=5936 RepID=A0AAD1UHL3_EUPCR|nr:unnamed protein product [Moneuplotes crassus]
MDSDIRNYIEKEGEIYVEDFMTEEDDSIVEPSQMGEEGIGIETILKKLVITRDKFILQRPGSINEDYVIERKIGKGANGDVYHAINKITNIERAIKKIPKSKISNIEYFLREVNTLKQLDHPNVIKLFEIYESANDVYLVQELCTGGELLDQILNENGLSENKAAIIFKQILQAILYCNSNKISHRDLKPENFMFASNKEGAVLKLIDFGVARSYYKKEVLAFNQVIRMKTRAGTTYFMAPEVILNNYTESCDMWSAGVILYIILSGVPPFGGETDQEVLENILRGEYDFDDEIWDEISEEAKDLIEKLLVAEEERLTPKQALEHSWIAGYSRLDSAVLLSHKHTERLRNFQKSKKLKKAVLTYLASRVSDEDIINEMKIFFKLDRNKDGYITLKELKEGMKSTPNIEEIADILKGVDIDKNGVINYTEFIAATLDQKGLMTSESLIKDAFQLFDKNNDGSIDQNELRSTLAGVEGELIDVEVWEDILKECDLDGDGKVSFDEFVHMMTNC